GRLLRAELGAELVAAIGAFGGNRAIAAFVSAVVHENEARPPRAAINRAAAGASRQRRVLGLPLVLVGFALLTLGRAIVAATGGVLGAVLVIVGARPVGGRATAAQPCEQDCA